MNLTSKNQYMDVLRKKYLKASKKEKGKILDEYCRNTKQDRKYIIKKFNYKIKLKEFRKNRETIYSKETIAILAKIWKVFDYPCGQRLKPLIIHELDRLRNQEEIFCSEEITRQLKRMGEATIDRRLKHEKEVLLMKKKE